MVMWWKHVIFFLLVPLALFSQEEVKVSAQIDQEIFENQPIKGSVTVTHDENLPVDKESFQLGNEPLKVEFLRNVRISPDTSLMISIYNFTIESQPAGLYILPAVRVTVGGKVYSSFPTSYTVKEEKPPIPMHPSSSATSEIILKIENIVKNGKELYPGQQLTVGYRYLFNYSIDLTKEEVPLLEAKKFRKIGGLEKSESVRDSLNSVEVTQKIEAVQPGDYHFEPGVIEGHAYRLGRSGRKEVAQTESRAESLPVTLTVLPFPEKDRPPSFNGALGESLQFNASLLTSNKVAVGDKITLLIKIAGKGQLSNMPMPKVSCQPGFSGFFRFGDLPPIETLDQELKTFQVEMRPLDAAITEVPSLAFSYFNPHTRTYTTLNSKAIPLTVTPRSLPSERAEPRKIKVDTEGTEEIPVNAIEIEGNLPLTLSDLKNKPFGTWWVLLIIPIGVGGMFFQYYLKTYLEKGKKLVKPPRSDELFSKALKSHSSASFRLLHQAFLLRLVEIGAIDSENIPLYQLPTTGPAGEVRTFLERVEERRFSGKEGYALEDLYQQAQELFHALEVKNRL